MSYNPLPIFYDSFCTQAVPSKVVGDSVFYEMKLGAVKTREVTYSDFYVKNQSLGNVENMSLKVESLDVGAVTVSLASAGEVKQLGVGEVYHGLLKWDAKEGAKPGYVESGGVVAVAVPVLKQRFVQTYGATLFVEAPVHRRMSISIGAEAQVRRVLSETINGVSEVRRVLVETVYGKAWILTQELWDLLFREDEEA